MRKLIKKILKEENDFDSLDWIKEIPSYKLGAFLDGYNVCTKDGRDCDIILEKDYITYKVDLTEWEEFVELREEDGHYLLSFIRWGEDHIDEYDHYELDPDEINYLGYRLTEEQKGRLQKIIDEINQDKNISVDEFIQNDEFSKIKEKLKYPTAKGYFESMEYDVLDIMGSILQKNRWISLGQEYKSLLKQTGVELETDHNWRGEDIIIKIPTNGIHKVNYDLSELLYVTSVKFVEVPWSDWFWEEWDTSGSEDDISYEIDEFLTKTEDFILNETDMKLLYDNFEEKVTSLGFEPFRDKFTKKIGEKYWFLEPRGDYKKVKIDVKDNFYGFYGGEDSFLIPLDHLNTYINNYRLDL